MRFIRRQLALLLAVLLVITGLAGCGEAEEKQQDISLIQVVSEAAEDIVEIVDLPVTEEEANDDYSETETVTEAVETAGQEETEELSSEADAAEAVSLDPEGSYDQKEDVALYIHLYGKLPSNYITKKEAEKLGWSGGSLEPYAPGKIIGGSNFGNYEGILPKGKYHECDIDTLGKKSRGTKRIVFSDAGEIYYTDDHYESFTLLYTADGPAEDGTVYR